MDLLASLLFSLSITGPICRGAVLGIWLKRLGLLPDSFVESASVWCSRSPCQPLFRAWWAAPIFHHAEPLAHPSTACLAPWPVSWCWRCWRPFPSASRKLRGIFVQGSFRGNMGISGAGLCKTPTARRGLGPRPAGGSITVLYNILAVITLTRSLGGHRYPPSSGIVKIPHHRHSGGAAPACSASKMPQLVITTGNYLPT